MTMKPFNPERHKQILTALLIEIAKKLNGKIAFKGGTAAMMFYGLPRMSLDLDFDVLDKLTVSELDQLKILLEKHGQIKEYSDKRYTHFYLLSYETDHPNIKVEINKRF